MNKFKIWDNRQKRMIQNTEAWFLVSEVQFPNGDKQELPLLFIALTNEHPKKQFVPLQFIGLKDKTGADIYNMDIVKVKRWYSPDMGMTTVELGEETGTVIWDNQSLKWQVSFSRPRVSEIDNIFAGHEERYEIVGNAYEEENRLIKTNAQV